MMMLLPIPSTTTSNTSLCIQHQHHVSSSSSQFPASASSSLFTSCPLRTDIARTGGGGIRRRCCSQVHSYGTVDYEKRKQTNTTTTTTRKWNTVYKMISLAGANIDAGCVVDEFERHPDGKRLNKWELCRIVKELRKFRRYNHALQVYEWMNNRAERFRMSTSDTAIQLDLVAKVHGSLYAEDYFFKLPDSVKDRRTYGALLNAYVQAIMRDQAESLIQKMQHRGYATNTLPFNLMMTLYMNLKEFDKVDVVVSDMRDRNIPLDIYSYNIWISSCGYQGSVGKMEQVLEQMKMDKSINPNWSTFSTLATMYIKLGEMEKAVSCLKMVENKITGRDRLPYHYLISLYSSVGKKDDVYRVWNVYKSIFESVLNLGYHTMISSLVRLDDIEGAENIYEEWILVKSHFDPRIANVLMGWYVREGLVEKAQALFDEMVESGGKGNALTWEILADGKIRERRVSEALSCLKKAVLVDESKLWKPKPVSVTYILEMCQEADDESSKDVLIGILRDTGCFEDEAYMAYIPLSNDVASIGNLFMKTSSINDDDGDIDGADMLLDQLQS